MKRSAWIISAGLLALTAACAPEEPQVLADEEITTILTNQEPKVALGEYRDCVAGAAPAVPHNQHSDLERVATVLKGCESFEEAVMVVVGGMYSEGDPNLPEFRRVVRNLATQTVRETPPTPHMPAPAAGEG